MSEDRHFPEDFLSRVKDASDIVSLIDGRVPLRKAGKDYAACCPFHTEKTPSFTVSPSKQFYHCFGCGAHGNVFTWRMEYEGLDFVEAVKAQAASVGVPVPTFQTSSPEARKRQEYQERLHAIVAAANSRFQEQLRGNPKCIDYLKGRGVTGKTARVFELGYAESGIVGCAPDATVQEMEDAGLVTIEEGGELRDRFRYRLMFPIHNERGTVVGFGGRVIHEGGMPKYLNSPEGPIFDKGHELYGLFQAKQSIRQDRVAVVVEGYLDVCMLHQHGEHRAVATLGTALTEFHARKLLRVANEVVFCFDGDKAGQKAAARAVRIVLPELADGKTVKFLVLPQEHDPDSYVRAYGIDTWKDAVAIKSEPLSSMLVRSVVAGRDVSIPENKAAIARDFEPLLGEIVSAPMFKSALQRHVEDLLGIRLRVKVAPAAKSAVSPVQHDSRQPDAVEGGEIQPVPGRFIFYDNLATLCGLDNQAAESIPVSQMDDFGALIVSWFSIAPVAGKERFEEVAKIKSAPLRKVLSAAVDRVEQKRLLFTPEALQREIEGLSSAITRVADQEAKKAAAGMLFGSNP